MAKWSDPLLPNPSSDVHQRFEAQLLKGIVWYFVNHATELSITLTPLTCEAPEAGLARRLETG